ncbi:MAG: hypothetical protein N2234_08785 [Planctomycetota bacterium]|nr:hypothetical protein [Planctomycetota bacterium]
MVENFFTLTLLILVGCGYKLQLRPPRVMDAEILHRLCENIDTNKEKLFELQLSVQIVPSSRGAELHLIKGRLKKDTETGAREKELETPNEPPMTVFLTRRLMVDVKKSGPLITHKPLEEEMGEPKRDNLSEEEATTGNSEKVKTFLEEIGDWLTVAAMLGVPYSGKWLPEGRVTVGEEWDVRFTPGYVLEGDENKPQFLIRMQLAQVEGSVAVIEGKIVDAICKRKEDEGYSPFFVGAPVLLEWDTEKQVLRSLVIGSKRPFLEVRWRILSGG